MPGLDFKLQKLNGHRTDVYDLIVNLDGDFETEDAFDTSIIVSIGTDARADPSEVAESHRRRGWPGNLLLQGKEMGGKVWQWLQRRSTTLTANGLARAVADSLEWLQLDGWLPVAPRAFSIIEEDGSITTRVDITRPSGEVEKRYFDLWDNTGDTLGS